MSELLASRLRQARGSLSLSEAASRVGIPESRIRMYEEGVRTPYGKTLRRMAEAYGMPVLELAPGTVAKREPAAPRQRRRRRRVAAPPDGRHVIEIPVDLREGEPVRVTLELILRPRSTQPAEAIAEAREEHHVHPPLTLEPVLAAQGSAETMAVFREAYDAFRRTRR